MLDGPASPDASPAEAWRAEAQTPGRTGPPSRLSGDAGRPAGPALLATALDAVLPERRTVVQDGGHFVGWAPMYWNIPRPQDLVMVGTAFQSHRAGPCQRRRGSPRGGGRPHPECWPPATAVS